MIAEGKIFSCNEVSLHNTSNDCWVIINAKAYNVTCFLSEHPGGDEVLLVAAGKDASQEFEDAGHGSAARLMLDEFYAGEIDPATYPSIPAAHTPPEQSKSATSKSSKFTFKILRYLALLAILVLATGLLFAT